MIVKKLRQGWEMVEDAFGREFPLPAYLKVADCGWCRHLVADSAVLSALSSLKSVVGVGLLKPKAGELRGKTACVECLKGDEWFLKEGSR